MADQTGAFDAIVVGGGHNGLIAASYLAGAKLRVLVLEQFSEVGGAAISEETFPGFKISTGSYVLSLAPRKILDELGAWAEGIELLERNPRFFAPFPDGSSLTYWKDHDEWIKQIRRISPKDADAYDHYDAFVERACAVMDKYILRRPPSWAEVAANFTSSEDALIFQKFYLGSAADIAEYFFDSEQMRAVFSASGLIGTFRGPRDAGTGYVKLYHSMGMATGKRGQWAYLRGAMGSFTQALKRVAQGLGVDIRTGEEVHHICVQGGRATGAVTKDGEEFHSRIVLSNADPKRTYLKLVGKQYLPDEYARDVENIQITSPVMKINFACDRLPEYPGLRNRGYELGQTGGVTIGPSIEYLQRAYEDARQGRPADWPFFSIHAQ